MSQRQLELAREFDRLHGRLRPHEAQSSELSPHDTATITEALDTIRQLNLSGQMRQSAEHLDGNRTGQATQLQQSVVDGLDELLDVFSQRRDAEQQRQRGRESGCSAATVAASPGRSRLDGSPAGACSQRPNHLAANRMKHRSANWDQNNSNSPKNWRARRGEEWVAATFRLGIQHAERPMREAEERLRQGSPGEATRASQSLAIRRLEMLATSLDTRPDPPAPDTESAGNPAA